jgi:uncharacterized protein YkwD
MAAWGRVERFGGLAFVERPAMRALVAASACVVAAASALGLVFAASAPGALETVEFPMAKVEAGLIEKPIAYFRVVPEDELVALFTPYQAPAAEPEAPAAPEAAAPAAEAPAAPAQPASPPESLAQDAPAPPPPPPPPPAAAAKPNFYVPAVSDGPATGLEQRLFDAMNAERVAAGLTPYVYDATLSKIARTRSQQMVDQGYFGHVDPYGYSMYVELIQYFGVTGYGWAGENLALNNFDVSESPERAVAALMRSPTHKANMLEDGFTHAGVGEVLAPDGRHIYSIIFVG